MFSDQKVLIPDVKGKIYFHKIKGTTYVEYEYDRVYKPDKKYNVPKRNTIGKLCDDDHSFMFPNNNYLKYFPNAELPSFKSDRSSCLRVGAYLVIKKIIEEYGLNKMLDKIIGKDAGLFLDLASYSIISESNVAQYYPDYAFNHPLFTEDMHIYSDSSISRFLSEVTIDQRISFFNNWNGLRNHTEKIYISYDSTNKICQAGDIEMTEIGHSKEMTDKPIINYSIAYDCNNEEPLFYEYYPGSIVDVSQLQYMLTKASSYGYENAGFILDRGYFSEPNIRYMDKKGYDFIIMVKGQKKLVNSLIRQVKGSFEESRAYSIREFKTNGITVKHGLYESDEKERYFHIYYSGKKAVAERELLEKKIDMMAKALKKVEGTEYVMDSSYGKYFTPTYWHEGQEDQVFMYATEKTNVIDDEIAVCGYFAIITSEEMLADEALKIYKSRDASEKLFRGDKSYLGDNCLRVYSDESAETKIFIEFVALIIRNKIYSCLRKEREENDANYMTVPAAIKELEKVEMIRIMDREYRLDRAITKTQRSILKAFGITDNYIKKQLTELSRQLAASK